MLSTRDDGYITGAQAATLARVKPGTIRQWVARGHLTRVGLDERGHNLYDPAAVRRTEAKLRAAARRIILPRVAA